MNSGLTVDDAGRVVIREAIKRFSAPNSHLLDRVREWPPLDERDYSTFSSGYVLTRDGTGLYVIGNTRPVVYHIDLRNGRSATLGGAATILDPSEQSWIAADDRGIFSADPEHAAINRADFSAKGPPRAFISGPNTRLHVPIDLAADRDGHVCTLDGSTSFLLCYRSTAAGNVAPAIAIDTKALGFESVDAFAVGRGKLAVFGTKNRRRTPGSASIAIYDISVAGARPVRRIGGLKSGLDDADSIAIDGSGDILVLGHGFNRSNNPNARDNELVEFGSAQDGNVAPHWVRRLATGGRNPFAMTIDPVSGDIALVSVTGTAYFAHAAGTPPARWPAPKVIPVTVRGAALSGEFIVFEDDFGSPMRYRIADALKIRADTRTADFRFHDPEFLARDQAGNVYVLGGNGSLTKIATPSGARPRPRTRMLNLPFESSTDGFAVDSAGNTYFSYRDDPEIAMVDARGRVNVISGSRTGLSDPDSLAVGRDGTLFVADRRAKAIVAFARGARGDVAPFARITVEDGLIAPQALAVDGAGRLDVFDGTPSAEGPIGMGPRGAVHFVRVFDPPTRLDKATLRASYPVDTECLGGL